MSEIKSGIARDMSKHLSAEIEKVMQRHIDLAQLVCSTSEVAAIALEVAVNVNCAAILVAIQGRKPEVTPEDMFDLAAKTIADVVQNRKGSLPEILAMMDQRKRSGVRR